jgi:hypothetical protein
VCSQGFTNKWRINQSRKYFDLKVNSVLTVTSDITSSISDNELCGNFIREALLAREKWGIEVRVVPLRPPSEYVVRAIMNKNWDDMRLSREERKYLVELKTREVLPGCEEFRDAEIARLEAKPYFQPREKNKELVPRFMHSDFQKLMDDGIGFCGRIGDLEYCDKCNLVQERISFHADELSPVEDIRYKKSRKKKKDFPLFTTLKQP